MLSEFTMLFTSVLIFICATLLLVYVSRRLAKPQRALTGTEDVEGIYITVLGSIYAIFIAFMVFVVWTRFDAATQELDQESAVLVNLYRVAQALPEPLESTLEQDIRDYVDAVLDKEWPAMARGEETPSPAIVLNQLWEDMYVLSEPNSEWADNTVTDHLYDKMGELARIRQSRLLHARLGIPALLWWVLIAGALLVSGFSIMFGTESFLAHSLKACMIVALITMLLFTIYALNMPFSGAVNVSSEPLQHALHDFDECDAGLAD